MDEDKAANVTEKKSLSGADSEVLLQKCLEVNKGDDTKCKDKVQALRSSSSTPSSSPTKPWRPSRLTNTSLSDV
ncbi:hypothetical protein F3Y22_tig00010927pilonHSYRG00030 [Hibiscus syriacus]|uniref:Uncharacterized protein n=1 Tax=Hibiscus syriacus TaxID=106335 RepID=A0A6A3C5J1_HIBSY|nr:hypothetical protein F3Y22_tig00010927pilonHSYRG00030 [Hibiscus syriacus]